MKPNDNRTAREDFLVLLHQAQSGNPTALNQFFKKLYEQGKHSLIKLTHSETQAEEYFQAAVSKFWLQCVKGKKELPSTNIEGYIYSMARFHCIDEMRKQNRSRVISEESSTLENNMQLSEQMQISIDQSETEDLKKMRKTAMHSMIKQLSENCQRLFQAILEEGIEKPKELMKALQLSEVRRVSVLKHECYKRLRVLTAVELEQQLSKRNVK